MLLCQNYTPRGVVVVEVVKVISILARVVMVTTEENWFICATRFNII